MIDDELRAARETYPLDDQLAQLIVNVASTRTVQVYGKEGQYVAMQPGGRDLAVAAYFHTRDVDIALEPGRARAVAAERGWGLVRREGNNATQHVKVRTADLTPETTPVVSALLAEALDRRESGAGMRRRDTSRARPEREFQTCPRCRQAMLGGHCANCD